MNLELIWVNYLGAEHNLGTIGEPSGKYDINRDPILIGDMVTFEYDKRLRSARVVKHWLTGNPQLLGMESLSDEIFNEQKLHLAPRDNLEVGRTVWVGLGDQPDRIVVREQKTKNYHHDPVRSGNPFTLATLAVLMMKNVERFKPTLPTYELLSALFGETKEGVCKYNLKNINEKIYSQNIRVWSPHPGHYFYMFVNGVTPEPLAYIIINEDILHGPNSHVERIIKSYFICENLNARVGMFIDEIYKPDDFILSGEEITVAGIEQGIRLILNKSKGV